MRVQNRVRRKREVVPFLDVRASSGVVVNAIDPVARRFRKLRHRADPDDGFDGKVRLVRESSCEEDQRRSREGERGLTSEIVGAKLLGGDEAVVDEEGSPLLQDGVVS